MARNLARQKQHAYSLARPNLSLAALQQCFSALEFGNSW